MVLIMTQRRCISSAAKSLLDSAAGVPEPAGKYERLLKDEPFCLLASTKKQLHPHTAAMAENKLNSPRFTCL
jgi:hypothetical protein